METNSTNLLCQTALLIRVVSGNTRVLVSETFSSAVIPRLTYMFVIVVHLKQDPRECVTSGEAAVQQINDSIAGRSANIEDEKDDLSEEELKIVWIFCRSLPKLQKEGKVPDKQISRDICKQLLEMLNPLFAKPRKARETTERRKRFTRGDRIR
uniref:BESS domain-containing protein n=1 Tax=Panagrellus redivivus TaxID=6233 RepID=A0A7E4VSW2_PANRE